MLIDKFEEVEALDEAIAAVLARINDTDNIDESAKLADQLTKLTKIKQTIAEVKLKSLELLHKKDVDDKTLSLKQAEAEKPDRVSKETLAVIAGNLAGIVLIIGYERTNVIASKALGFIMKSR